MNNNKTLWIIISVLLGSVSSILTEFFVIDIADNVQPYIKWAGPVLVIILVFIIFITIKESQRREENILSLPDLTLTEEQSIAIAEFGALRDEILFRLKSQQGVINKVSLLIFCILVFPVLLLAFINPKIITIGLLMCPIYAFFLQLNYYKQHAFIAAAANYIATYLPNRIYRERDGNRIFANKFSQWFVKILKLEIPDPPQSTDWEEYLTNTFYRPGFMNFASAATGYAEGGLPSLAGFSSIIIAISIVTIFRNQYQYYEIWIAVIWGILDGLIILGGFIIGLFIRRWVANLRRTVHN